MKRLIFLAVAMSQAGCTWDDPPRTETRDVNIAVAQPCTVDTKNQRPALLNLDQLRAAIVVAPNSDTRAQIITNQLLAHMGWLPVVEDAMKGCSAGAAQGSQATTGSTPR